MCQHTEGTDAVTAYCQFEEGITCDLSQNERVESHIAERGYVEDQKLESEATRSRLSRQAHSRMLSDLSESTIDPYCALFVCREAESSSHEASAKVLIPWRWFH